MSLSPDDQKFIRQYILNAAPRVPSEVSYAEALRALAILRMETTDVEAELGRDLEPEPVIAGLLTVTIYRNGDGQPVRSVIEAGGLTSSLQQEPTEALLELIKRGALQRDDYVEAATGDYVRFYNAMKLVKMRLKEIGMAHAVSSKRGHGYYWNRTVQVAYEEKPPIERAASPSEV